MLRPFAGTTLVDIVLGKLARCAAPSFFAGYEPEFEQKARAHSVTFVARDQRSVTIDGPIVDILSFLRPLEYDYFLFVNGCLPLLTLDTINAFLRDCVAHGCQPSFSVGIVKNHLMTMDRRPLNFDITNKTIDTKTVTPVYEFGHALYFFSKEYFFAQGTLWDWHDVRLLPIENRLELVDVDTEDDFTIAECLWKGLHPPGGEQR